MDRKPLTSQLADIARVLLYISGFVMLFGLVYTLVMFGYLRTKGVYSSPEAGMLARIEKNYIQPDQYEIIHSGTNSTDGSAPNVRYVIACIWGGTRSDGSAVGSYRHSYDQPGSFFLSTRDGWIYAPEGAFPQFIGFWMRVYGLAGDASSAPFDNWGSGPQHCEF